MKNQLNTNTELVSYFLWEYTKHRNALDLWYCAEELGFFLHKCNITSVEQMLEIIRLPRDDKSYISFVRNVAFRIFIFTSCHDSNRNWFVAERLIHNPECIGAFVKISKVYSAIHEGATDAAESIRGERIKKHFTF